MPDYSPTIIAASLNDNELKSAIDKLVKYVDDGALKMAESFNAGVQLMRESLQSLGKGNIANNIFSQAKAHNEVSKALEKEAVGYNNLERARSRAVGRREIKHDYVQLDSDVDKHWSYIIDMNKDVDAQLQHMIEHEQKLIQEKEREAQVTREIQQVQQAQIARGGVSGASLGWADVNSAGKRSREMANGAKEVNYLRQQVASLLEVEEREIRVANTTTSSYAQLNQYLKQLQTSYQRLGADRIAKGEGVDIVNEIQRIQRAMSQLNAQMSRPTSWSVVDALPTKTLDDIAYKIQMLQRYRSGLDWETQPKEITKVNSAIDELNKKQRELVGSNKSLLESNNALARSWNYMKNRLAFYFTVGASTAFVRNLIEVRSQYEMNERALGILVDSASRGTRIFNELSQMSLVSPYTLIELSTAAKQLTAYDIAAKDVVDTTRRLADMAAAVGAPVERLTYALGQIKAYGYLNSRDARMFANAGIPLVKQLAEYYSELEGKLVSAADVYDRMKKKAIDFNAVMAVVNKMTDEGGKFFDFQAKMADTLKVRLANLTLAWNNMLNDIGKGAGGFLNNSIKSVTILFRHWRELSRVLGTIVTAIGAYKTATWLAAVTTSASIGKSSVAAWLSLASGVRSAKDATALFSLTIKSIPFVGWVTAIASLVSWFYLFNQSGDEVKQKLQDIQSAFDGVRKEIDDLFADAIRTDSIGTQLTKLQSMLETAETELGVVIPINLEDVNESNIKQKLKEARNFIDTYLNFSQTFSEAAAGSRFNEAMNEFGSNARTIYTSITESINSVVVALQELSDKGEASKRDIEILNELIAGQKEDESRIEYLQRLVRLYEELGLIGKKEYTPNLGISAIWRTYNTNMEDLQAQQEKNIERLGIKNKSVFESMLNDVQGYYSSSQGALSQFEKQIERVAQKIDINSIPVEQRTLRLQVAINEEASLNNWNEFEKEYARQIANQKYGTQIEISSDSKKSAETELQDWQKRQQEWMDNHGIKVNLSFQTDETEASYASRMLQEAKDAQNKLEIQKRKLNVGTGSQEDVDNAIKDLNEAIEKARAAGADLSQLDKKKGGSKKDILGDALAKELQLITDIQKLYKEYTKAGVDSETAKNAAAKEYQKTLEQTNNTLSKFGVQGLTGEQLATMDLRAMRDYYQSILDKVQSSPKAVEALEKAIRNLNIEITKEGQKTIIDSLNSELSKLKDEYELAVELDANPELGENFATMFGIVPEALPHTIEEYADRAVAYLNNYLKEGGQNLELPSLNLTPDDIKMLSQLVDEAKLGKQYYDEIIKSYNNYYNLIKKSTTDVEKYISDYIKEYGDASAQLQEIEKEKNEKLKELDAIYQTEELRQTQEYLDKRQMIIDASNKKLAKSSFETLKRSDDYERFFTAIDTLTDEDALNIKNKIKQDIIDAFKKGGLTIWQFRKEIKAVEQQFDKLSKASTIWGAYIQGGFDGAINRAKELGQELEIIGNKISANGSVDEKDKNWLSSLGSIFTTSSGQSTDFAGLMQSFGGDMKGLGGAIGKAGAGMQGAANGFASAVAVVDTIIKNIHGAVEGINQMMSELNEGRNEDSKVGGWGWDAFSKADQYISSGWEKLKSGNFLGAAMDTVNTFIAPIASIFRSRNKKITEQIEESERVVKKLSISYNKLSDDADKAYGVEVSGARQAVIENKKLQLVEAERQLALEKSRKKKFQDQDKIIELQGQVEDLKREIKNASNDIVNDLLGISSAGDGITNLVQVMIDAFRNGEDAMDAFGKEWDKMIDNMILKLIVSQYMKTAWDEIMSTLDTKREEFLQQSSQAKADAEAQIETIKNLDNYELGRLVGLSHWESIAVNDEFAEKIRNVLIKRLESTIERANGELDRASQNYTEWSLDYMMNEGRQQMLDAARKLQEGIDQYYDYGELAEGQALSNLQQGIQGITEDTAGALEAYMNGVSQQVYLHSDLLTQIRDAVVGFDLDVQLGVQSQILLELQNSYQVQMSIQNILQGVLNPSGRAFMVEME